MVLSLSSVNSFASERGLRELFPFLAAFTKYNTLAIRSQLMGAGAAWVLTCGAVSPPQAAYPHSGGTGSRRSNFASDLPSRLLFSGRVEGQDQRSSQRVLRVVESLAFLEDRLRRHIVTELCACNQVRRNGPLQRCGDFVEVLRRPRSETVVIFKILVAKGGVDRGSQSVLQIPRSPCPIRRYGRWTGDRRDFVAAPVVDVRHQTQFASGIERDHGIGEMSPVGVVIRAFRATDVILDEAELLRWGPSGAHADGLTGVVVDDGVPAVHHISG